MKKNYTVLILMLLAAAFQWGCEKDVVVAPDDAIEFRKGKPGGGGGNGGGDKTKPLYKIEVTGDVVYGEPSYGIHDGSNKKSDVISGHICGATWMHGIDTTSFGCYPDVEYCGLRNVGINHKNTNPGFVSSLFLFNRYEESSSTRFRIYGYVDGGGNSLFPTVAGPAGAVTVTITQYKIELGPAECEVPEFTTIVDGNGVPSPSILTITLLTETDPAVVCAGITPCVAPPL